MPRTDVGDTEQEQVQAMNETAQQVSEIIQKTLDKGY
jgi:hypothetical protein